MSWTAGDRDHKFLLEMLPSDGSPAVIDSTFNKVFPTDVRIDYLDQESTPSLQSISSGSESQRGGQRGFDMDSLSEEGDSDESGFVETTAADDKIRDLPSHQLVKPRLDPSKSASLQELRIYWKVSNKILNGFLNELKKEEVAQGKNAEDSSTCRVNDPGSRRELIDLQNSFYTPWNPHSPFKNSLKSLPEQVSVYPCVRVSVCPCVHDTYCND
ncbi:unnamed protein product [Nesidiocoris tenuis]|uniref:Uncharacterized protein n=1 Tax=Nesidiocoris tenuis TaxID=355587 RepID=A0A6H5FST4_9HEMI|nr:unnamed protein product [Nesidiocoris tenuis]